MCGFHNFPDGNFFRRVPPPSASLIEETRKAERAMPGTPVPDEAWETFFSPVCGAINLRDFERMFRSRQVALSFLVMRSSFRKTVQEKFRIVCIED